MTETTRTPAEDGGLRSELVVFLATVGTASPDDHPWVTTARRLADRVKALDAAAEREARLRERVEELESALRKPVRVEIITGVEGHCLAVDNYRVAGPKPWGGGKVIVWWTRPAYELARIDPALLTLTAPAGAQEGTE